MQHYYSATWDSVKTHRLPDWYDDYKFGIFIHWGIYSVPAYAPLTWELGEVDVDEQWFCNNPYAEWYFNSINVKRGPTYEHHLKTYGKDFAYRDFLPMWKAEKWQPTEWAKLFREVGAKYVVLTTKHHDGFCLFPSQYTDYHCLNYGPKRDIMGELTESVRAEGLKMGAYYSGVIDWTFSSAPIFTESQNMSNACPTYSEMVERFKRGVPIRIKYYDQTEQIYEYIQRHLEAWADRLSNGINIMAAPIDDLVAMNDFANSLFPYARAYINTEATGSPFMRAISKAGFSKFSSEFFGTKEDSKERADKERQDMSEVFKRARSTISS